MEIWKDIPGYEGLYQCSNLGRIKSLPRKVGFSFRKGKILSFFKMGKYLGIFLSKKGEKKNYYVHRLIASVFLKKLLIHTEVNHKDRNKFNNRIINLEWVTTQENREDYSRLKSIEKFSELLK